MVKLLVPFAKLKTGQMQKIIQLPARNTLSFKKSIVPQGTYEIFYCHHLPVLQMIIHCFTIFPHCIRSFAIANMRFLLLNLHRI
ncbi:MAG: hypothetical protein Q8941_11930 [Bacteroidota bacterium]|nr:hypothetical protein [Bacteroidota bacterium]